MGASDQNVAATLAELQALRQRIIELEQAQAAALGGRSRAAVQAAVSGALATATTAGDGLVAVLRTVCESMEWDWGGVWIVDGEELRLRALWHPPGVDVEPFSIDCRTRSFTPGMGLPGRVWETGDAAWIADVVTDENFPRAPVADRVGLHGAFAFPIRTGDGVHGVIEFFSREIREPDDDLLDVVRAIGGQLGQFVERLRAERDLRESEARVRAILGASLDAVITMDHRGRIREFNAAAERMFGYGRENVVGREMASVVIPPELRDAHRAGLAAHLSTGRSRIIGQRVEIDGMRGDGSQFPVELTIVRVESAGRPVFAGYLRDITERRRSEERAGFLAQAGGLLSSSLDYETTLASVARLAVPFLADWCIVYLQGEDGEIRRLAMEHANPDRDEVFQLVQDRHPIDPDANEGAPRVIRTGVAVLYDDPSLELLTADVRDPEQLRAAGGEPGVCSWMCVPLAMPGRVFGAMSFMAVESARHYDAADLDLATEIGRRAAVAVEHARLYREAREAILAREEFLSIAAHELKTPLTSVKASAQLLRRWFGDERIERERIERLMEQLGTEIVRLETLVSDLLDASRIHQGRLDLRLESTDLVQLVRSVVERFEHVPERTRAHTLSVEGDRAVPGFWDPSRLDQVVTNLVSNALKYSPAGGAVRLRVTREGGEALLSVADEGVGISEQEQQQLFEPFARAESIRGSVSGTGLGLFIAARIIERHGGTISVTSSPGQGTILVIRVPLIARDGSHASQRDETAPPEGAAIG